MKEFHITSTITIEAKSREEAEIALLNAMHYPEQSDIVFDLINSAQIDEA